MDRRQVLVVGNGMVGHRFVEPARRAGRTGTSAIVIVRARSPARRTTGSPCSYFRRRDRRRPASRRATSFFADDTASTCTSATAVGADRPTRRAGRPRRTAGWSPTTTLVLATGSDPVRAADARQRLRRRASSTARSTTSRPSRPGPDAGRPTRRRDRRRPARASRRPTRCAASGSRPTSSSSRRG